MLNCRLRFVVLSILFLIPSFGPAGPAVALGPLDTLKVHPTTFFDQPVPNASEPPKTNGRPGKTGNGSDAASWSMAIMADLHVCAENLPVLRRSVQSVNSLTGVFAVALVGDLCKRTGTPRELELAAHLVDSFADPVFAVPGNHDFMYKDETKADGKMARGTPAGKRKKLENFRKAMKQPGIRFAKKVGGHLLVFLPVDACNSKPLCTLSDETIGFLKKTLGNNRGLPTIVFCHAPLEGSCGAARKARQAKKGFLPHAYIQPAERIRDILRRNPQVFLWIAGHLHIKPSAQDFQSKTSSLGGVTVIHVPNLTQTSTCIRLLELTPSAAVVRTFDTGKDIFLTRFDRKFSHHRNHGTPNPVTTSEEPPEKPAHPRDSGNTGDSDAPEESESAVETPDPDLDDLPEELINVSPDLGDLPETFDAGPEADFMSGAEK